MDRVGASLRASGVEVLQLDAERAQSPGDLTLPISEALGCGDDRLTATSLAEGVRLRVLIDNCDVLHDKGWFLSVQDEWRGLLGEQAARGRVAFLLCGRPLFRRVAEGRGSPLLGIGQFVPSRPLSVGDAQEGLDVDAALADIVLRKTGGHPRLTGRLVAAIEGDLARLEARYVEFTCSERRYMISLVDDHGDEARAVLVDLLEASRGTVVARSAIMARRFGGATLVGQDTLDDLAASGLIKEIDGGYSLGAEMLRTDRDLWPFLAAPEFHVTKEPSPELSLAAADVFRAENELRELVGEALRQADETWWPSRFPAAVVREVETRRRSEAESPAPMDEATHPISYLTLGELVDAVLEDANWEQVFRVRLGTTRDEFAQTTAMLGAVRNKVAHNREVTQRDLDVLRMALDRLSRYV